MREHNLSAGNAGGIAEHSLLVEQGPARRKIFSPPF
jgi:hypothetical protein